MAKTIIVVDDNEIIREYTTYLLEEANYIVVPTASREEAAKVLSGVVADAIVLDWRMNGLNIHPFLALLDSLSPRPQVVVTSSEPVETEVRAMALPFLRKPFGPMELLNTIQNSLVCASA